VAESRERIRACFHTLGIALPNKKITVNLSPGDLPKEGAHFDLPIALGVMGALRIFETLQLENYITLGELSLDGHLQDCVGILPASLYAQSVGKGIICPYSAGKEASWTGVENIIPAKHLTYLINHLKGDQIIQPPSLVPFEESKIAENSVDMKDVRGQILSKRALEIAAVGSHNVLMTGPPGAGKSMLAKRFPTLLPSLTASEALEISVIHSLAGLLPEKGLVMERPFRDPHHSISSVALVGGGQKVKPGEISLAHRGVLFLDELPEFQRFALEALRQPIETGEILVARANMHLRFPAKFQLIAAMNPCRCGHMGDAAQECSKAPICGSDYQKKLSGPLLDRFDLFIPVEKIEPSELIHQFESGESSASIKQRVEKAIGFQKTRNQTIKNADLNGDELRDFLETSEEMNQLLEKAFNRLRLSARGFYRLLKVSRTIADLDSSDMIKVQHLSEAMQYRPLREIS
jgi:magnesium chelatase family protein